MVDVGPLTPGFQPPEPTVTVCCCRQCLRGPECAAMRQRRAERYLTQDDRAWLGQHGWTAS